MPTQEQQPITCTLCGATLEEGISLFDPTGDNRFPVVCPSCMDTDFSICDYCGAVVENDDILQVNRSFLHRRWSSAELHFSCPDCASFGEEVFTCRDCEEVNERRFQWGEYNGEPICDNCSGDYVSCEDCCETFLRDDLYYDYDDECFYCEDCYNSRRRHGSHLHDYNYKPYPAFKKCVGEETERFFGIEQETDCGDDRDDYSDALYDALGENFFVQKTDGSLDEGIELVSHPCTLQFFRMQYPLSTIKAVANKHGFTAHDNGNCGLHIHVSRACLGRSETIRDVVIAKLNILMNVHWDNLVKFSRRRSYELERWAAKPDAGITRNDDILTIAKKAADLCGKDCHDGRRYVALNTQNRNTIEFRLFRGSLNPETVLAAIELCDVLVDFAINHSTAQCWNSKWETVIKSEYPELNAYLNRRHLYDGSIYEEEDC